MFAGTETVRTVKMKSTVTDPLLVLLPGSVSTMYVSKLCNRGLELRTWVWEHIAPI